MSRKESKVAELHSNKGTWKIAVRITDMWMVTKKNGKRAVEMVLMDEVGSKIGATLTEELFPDFLQHLQCGVAYVLQNIKVVETTSEYKVSKLPYIVYFVQTTSLKTAERPEIPPNTYTFTSFADIIHGVAQRDTLVDIVGVIVDIVEQYTMRQPYRVTVTLRDNSGVELVMTLWEEFAAQLGDALDNNRGENRPLVVMLSLAKIKDATEKYPLSVQNVKQGSKLYVNAEIPEVLDFLASLDLTKPYYSSGASQQRVGSQSQNTQYSQSRFLHNARMVSMENISKLRQECYCLSVGVVDEIMIDSPWSYDSCTFCTTTFDPNRDGTKCRTCNKIVTETVPRFKLVLKLEHNGHSFKFHFWDQICTKILQKTASDCRQELVENGDDIKVFPGYVDELIGKLWAVRFKFRVHMRQASVLDVSEDPETIQAILTNLDLQLDDVSSTHIKKSIGESSSQQPHPTPSLSDTADYDPEIGMLMTPAKRLPENVCGEDLQSQEYTPFQLSTNKHLKSK